MKKRSKVYLILGIILTIILVGCFAFYARWRNTYAAVDTANPIEQLSFYEKNDSEITVVFYRTGCAACNKAEHVIVPNVRKAREKGQEVIVMDVSKLSKHEMAEIKERVPAAFANNHVPTPQIVKLKTDGMGDWETVNQSSLTTLDLRTLRQMLVGSDS
ncbi:hypothetical protein LMB49_03845 [Limosilactobacillus reuteri]|uniref:hypothetical protein n=1 Tax=Limosilactobacillus reuteri TaxID=1598 RepID=UPI001E3D78EF|nr:hypothetical protein [Limosilactobacillus reuteri]MCC4370530.1 hypothetical protein [Limosilactobacillus reuteri]MCC4509415.1 hypothetical protein [Limosilactobacillus reuteri]